MRVFISSLIGLALSIVVAPKYGALGCAAATGLALVLTQILYIDFYQRKMGLDMRLFFKQCHLKIAPLIVIYAIAGYFVGHYLTIDSWFSLLLSIAIYVIGYCLLVWLFLANDYEKNLLLGFLKKEKV